MKNFWRQNPPQQPPPPSEEDEDQIYIRSISKYTFEIRKENNSELINLLCDEIDRLRKENMILDVANCYKYITIKHCFEVLGKQIE